MLYHVRAVVYSGTSEQTVFSCVHCEERLDSLEGNLQKTKEAQIEETNDKETLGNLQKDLNATKDQLQDAVREKERLEKLTTELENE